MYYATSYHFFIRQDGVLVATDTWVVKEDTPTNRYKTKKWFKKLLTKYYPNSVSDAYEEFLDDHSKGLITDDVVTIHVRHHAE